MSLSEYLPLKDENLNQLLPQLDLDVERLKEKLKPGVDLVEVDELLKTIRDVASKVETLISPLREVMDQYLKLHMQQMENNIFGGANTEEMDTDRELNNLLYLKEELLEIRRSIMTRLRELSL